jgi:hypothetical protein
MNQSFEFLKNQPSDWWDWGKQFMGETKNANLRESVFVLDAANKAANTDFLSWFVHAPIVERIRHNLR